jgi:hypothetical protein
MWPGLVHAHERKVTADQATQDQKKEENEPGGASRAVAFARLFPSGTLLDQLQFKKSR